ncbi:SAM-dependent methyltransferase [Salipaludibacillus neizhouensis]|uniref:SAM-dependent methyltransferase n=2 Tax=Salipaludibacillus neizhouensis TaxID=885475 RepID=A0A3A9KA52_9BACI|nr:class I SAM-dependent methyltransferase [Salipaludibacillus neizhouensis]RKL67321.1 SAM-dependent methyltransferase [Salipaludibacillus neizhouensis]
MKPTNVMLLEHLARYYFAFPYAKGRVLDLACGTGYGGQIVAKAKKKVISEMVGVDIHKETIEYATKTYYHPLLTFQMGDVLDPNFRASIGTFDTIMSFETIEHVPDDQEFLSSIYKLLKPGGILILSTPFGAGKGIKSAVPFHYHQLTETELIDLFNGSELEFQCVDFYFQLGVVVEKVKRPDAHYPIGIVVAKKAN